MHEPAVADKYKRYRFPPAIIASSVWRSFRFALRYRDVAGLLAERGVLVTDETVRRWCRTFGQSYANALRRQRPRPGDIWHLDGVFMRSNGVQHSPWRAVDREGNVLDILVQPRRDTAAATTFFRRLLQDRTDVPCVLITDTLPSDGAAKREVLPSVEPRQHKRRNHRAEHAPQPTRRFKRPGHARRFLAAYGPIAGHSRPRRHRLTASAYRQTRDHRFATWQAVTITRAMR